MRFHQNLIRNSIFHLIKFLFNTAKNMKLELDFQSPQSLSVSHDSVSVNSFQTGSEEVKKTLRSGIKLAKEGNRVEARQVLLQVTEAEANNETAWLWLASISEYPEELLVFLQNVLKINPANERAIEWEHQTKSLLSKTFVQRGINASHQNQKEFAKQCFLQAIVHDQQNEMAWLWLASSSDVPEEKCLHLQKVLNINPDNKTAISSLKAVKNQVSQALLKKANSAAISGNHVGAREMLDEIMKYVPDLEDAWILKAFLANDYYEKISCYEKALEINPEHDAAQAGLNSLKTLVPKSLELKVETAQPVVNQDIVALDEDATVENDEVLEPFQDDLAPVEEISTELSDVLTEEPSESITQELTEEIPPEQLAQEIENDEYQPEAVQAENQVVPLEDFYTNEEVSGTEAVEETKATSESIGQAQVETEENQAEAQEVSKELEVFQSKVALVSAEEVQPDEAQPVVAFEPEYREPSQFTQNNEVEIAPVSGQLPIIEITTPAYPVSEYSNNGFAMLSQDGPFADYQQPTVEFSYSEMPAYNQPEVENKVETFVPQSAFGQVEDHQVEFAYQAVATDGFVAQVPENNEVVEAETARVEAPQIEAPQIEAQTEVVTQALEMPPAPVELRSCPFCAFENQAQAVICETCQAILSLSDLEMLLAHQGANQDLVLRAVEQMEVEKTLRDFSVEELQNLGIAQLNVHNLRKGFAYLQEASQLNPNDVVLASKVNFLTIRLNEIEEHDQKVQENPVRSRTILVVDDSPTVRKLISGKLEKCGHSVVSAVDGMDALAKINEVIPDLILLDITMPRLDGYQVCKMIRNNEVTKDIPIVMISGKDGFFDKVRGRMAGSTGYITKPFGPDTLMKTIETYIA